MRQALVKPQPVTTTLTWLPRGQKGTVQTLRLMAHYCRRDAANTQLREVAHQILGNIAGHDFSSEIRALFYFTRDHITYRKDPMEVERVQDALRTLQFGSGDCDDKVTLLVSLLATCGHRARFCVAGNAPGTWTHVYCEVMTPRGWLALDPTRETANPGWEMGAPCKGVFEIWPAVSTNIHVVRATVPTQATRQAHQIRPAAALGCEGCGGRCGEYGLGADTYEWKMNKGSGECELKKKSCGFWCHVGGVFKTVGKIGIAAAGAIAAPFTGGLSLAATAAIGGGIAAAQAVVSKYTANVPAGSNVAEPSGECAVWLAKKQQEEAQKAQEAAAAAAQAQAEAQAKAIADAVAKATAEKETSNAASGSGLMNQPVLLAALVIGGAMVLSRN